MRTMFVRAYFWLAAVVLAAPLAASAAPDTGIAFITGYYQHYLSMKSRAAFPIEQYYSRGLRALVAENTKVCATLARGDDICGYGANGDVVLDAEEEEPGLNFRRSAFEAHRVRQDWIEVSFALWPGKPEMPRHRLRYRLAREGRALRIDDVLTERDGKFVAEHSMRGLIALENANVRKGAAGLAEAMQWTYIYIQGRQADRFARFAQFPLRVCEAERSCVSYARGDRRIVQVVARLQQAYQGKDGPNPTGALTFALRDGAWWVTAIDLARLRP